MPLPAATPDLRPAATDSRATADTASRAMGSRTATAVLMALTFRLWVWLWRQLWRPAERASYSGSDSAEMQAARNFIVNGRYTEARRVLDSMANRNARWYYLSSLANQGLGKSIDALQDARRAVQMDPNNTEYQMHLRQMQNPGQNYRTQTTYTQSGGVTQWCWNLILLNLLCNCCCGGRMFFRPLFCF